MGMGLVHKVRGTNDKQKKHPTLLKNRVFYKYKYLYKDIVSTLVTRPAETVTLLLMTGSKGSIGVMVTL